MGILCRKQDNGENFILSPKRDYSVNPIGLKPEKVQRFIIRQLKQTVILLNTLPSALDDGT